MVKCDEGYCQAVEYPRQTLNTVEGACRCPQVLVLPMPQETRESMEADVQRRERKAKEGSKKRPRQASVGMTDGIQCDAKQPKTRERECARESERAQEAHRGARPAGAHVDPEGAASAGSI